MNYIGIDPGLDGAFALIMPSRLEAPRHLGVAVHDTPATSGRSRLYRESDMVRLVREAQMLGPCVAAIERVQAIPGFGKPCPVCKLRRGMGSTQAVQSGAGWGLWRGILASCGVPYEIVSAQAWKAALGFPKGAGKDRSLAVAQRLYPSLAAELTRKKDHGRAEAVLIAHWLSTRGGSTVATAAAMVVDERAEALREL